ncbi:PREDICTED: uncharacterized protein K02A2.6-like [Cyphomyrmex costatus]|uniref:uncharacterized protein K02A2.6-like n=1 Tax=Cyphomyrmex costatus TaxID=456900 RepID=UPI000852466C|nr:PREDICTED: uncharacterized protein K02A2.6-like [Cyphomyrmex costatus]
MDWTEIKKQSSQVCCISNELSLDALLKEYSDVFDQPIGTIKGFKAKLMLKEDAIPCFSKPCTIPLALQDKVDKELEKMIKSGVISHIETSKWASPLVIVPKPNRAVCITGDFKRTINDQLHVQQYPLARVDEILEKVSGGQTFTKLDGPDTFHQVEVEESCKKYLVINTHRGLYRYNVLPQGIASSPAIFQELMDQMLKGIPMAGSFVDDTISTGKNDEAHLQNLRMILQRMREWNFRLSSEKCIFMQQSVKFLGQILCAEGICTDPEKVESIMSMREPRDVKEVKSFLRLVNFYSKSINNLPHLRQPLKKLTRDGVVWNWNNQCKESFNRLKESVSSAPVLVHYQQNVPIGISCDASSVGIGVVLFHRYEDSSEQPISFASKTLLPAERDYSQVEKKALSIVFGVKHFIQYLYGHRFILITDHNPLVTIFSPNRELPSLAETRLHRWAMFLSGFLYDIKYRKTCHLNNARTLSYLPLDINQPVDIVEEEIEAIIKEHPIFSSSIKLKTILDPTLLSVIGLIRKGWPHKPSRLPDELKPYFTHRDELLIVQGIVMWGTQVVVPEALRQQILEQLHETHSGVGRMMSLASNHVWWPGIHRDIRLFVKSCTSCAVSHDNAAPLHPWSFSEKPWQHLHIDLAGPILNSMWLIIVDAYSKWPEIYNLENDTSSAHVIQCIRESIARYGTPDTIVSDNGPQFLSREFEEFCKSNGIRYTKSSAYHLRSNEEVKRFVRMFKNCMKRSTKHAQLDNSELNKQEKQQQQFSRKVSVRQFSNGDKVWVRTFGKNDPKWSLGIIIKSIDPVSYIVQADDRTIK